ncbi:MAG: acyltransferase [Candidatus Curtissbacteria bacterium]
MGQARQRIDWIDYLRGLAIIAVVGNHLWGYAFTSLILRNLTAFSVSLFILLSGYTSAMAIERSGNYFRYAEKRLVHILLPYLLVSIFYQLATSPYPLSLKLFLVNIFTFSANPVLYFVFVYLQLTLVAPFIVRLAKNSSLSRAILCLTTVFILGFAINHYFSFNSIFLPENKTIGGVYINGFVLGADKLLGGSYLFLFVLGIYLRTSDIVNKLEAKKGLLLFGSILGTALIFGLKHEDMWSNPPNIWLIGYTLLVFSAVFSFVKMKIKYMDILFAGLRLFGRNSLYIFLLHPAFIKLATDLTGHLQGGSQLAYWLLALVGPILVCWFLGKVLNKLTSQNGFLKFR